MPNVIGLIGRKRSGKDTFGKILVENYGFKRMAFADHLKEISKSAFNLTDEQLSDEVLKETEIKRFPYQSPRQILQLMGTDCFRTVWPDIWIEHIKSKIEESTTPVVVTDVRFPNEVNMLKTFGAKLVKINADDRLGPSKDGHVSESGITTLPYDHELLNNGSVELFNTYCKVFYDEKLR